MCSKGGVHYTCEHTGLRGREKEHMTHFGDLLGEVVRGSPTGGTGSRRIGMVPAET